MIHKRIKALENQKIIYEISFVTLYYIIMKINESFLLKAVDKYARD